MQRQPEGEKRLTGVNVKITGEKFLVVSLGFISKSWACVANEQIKIQHPLIVHETRSAVSFGELHGIRRRAAL